MLPVSAAEKFDMDLTKVGDTKWNVNQSNPSKIDRTGAKQITAFKKDIQDIKASTSVYEMLDVKRSKNKRQFLIGNV